MTKEELEEEAEEFLGGMLIDPEIVKLLVHFAEPREKRIAELEKENARQKAELDAIDKAGEHARQQINDAFRNKRPYWELEKENAELEMTIGTLRTFSNEQATCIESLKAQIEKMKQCGNCGNRTIGNCEHCKRKPKQKSTDTNDYWKL